MKDTKPVLRSGVPPGNSKNIESLCKEFGLYFLKKRFDDSMDKQFYISKSRGLPRKAYEAERQENKKEIGRLLGYPECCVNSFLNYRTKSNSKIPMIIHTFSKTKGKPSFYTNNIFNSNGRSSNINQKLLRNKERLKRHNHFLISHIPCSYNCKKSIEIGTRTLRLMKQEMPEFASEVLSSLRRVFIVFDEFEFVALRGKINKNEVRYSDPIVVNLESKTEKALKQGNRIVRGKDKIEIFKDKTPIYTIKRKDENHGVVMDFT
ncbi:MAG: DUF483 domain-containing protein [Candidatus Aenigmarchaeota archaeon]|nr:DUF483 domain-containing protein [Candidatus Aenigmarchaeota archaeon]